MPDSIKKIKFCIRINGVPCHTLNDLQQNFYLQDVIELYIQGILTRWLDNNGHKKELSALSEIDTVNDKVVLGQKLAEVLCPEFDKNSLSAALKALEYEAQLSRMAEIVPQGQNGWPDFIQLYHDSFEELLQLISERRADFEFLCHAAVCLVENYWQLVEGGIQNFLARMFDEAPCIFFPLLILGKFRDNGYGAVIREALAGHLNSCLSWAPGRPDSDVDCMLEELTKANKRQSKPKKIASDNDTRGHYLALSAVKKIIGGSFLFRDTCFSEFVDKLSTNNSNCTAKTFFHFVHDENLKDSVRKKDGYYCVTHDIINKFLVIYTRHNAHVSRCDYIKPNGLFPILSKIEFSLMYSCPLLAYIEIPEYLKEKIILPPYKDCTNNNFPYEAFKLFWRKNEIK
ncbi:MULTISPECIES: hypothetical protein [Desulfovibrio]|uniref:Uncharacterized protein n=1 Tax=Desulfovibrio desulfuricans TaxID=876 RepID=A0AA94L181_DESDE|nr:MULTISPECIES: hypothetical protein [Desulfovibrio]ATD80527.1 hypothetical protein CNY67_03090 [Desulfovibrio sp. G11]SFW20662.1 hypothetical protein SAMN02910291_00373 [Desulfovibrio desulfuricans]SPD36017.1 Hypothetical protein DSVG11_1921 [Desulfovibrio sp. G11]